MQTPIAFTVRGPEGVPVHLTISRRSVSRFREKMLRRPEDDPRQIEWKAGEVLPPRPYLVTHKDRSLHVESHLQEECGRLATEILEMEHALSHQQSRLAGLEEARSHLQDNALQIQKHTQESLRLWGQYARLVEKSPWLTRRHARTQGQIVYLENDFHAGALLHSTGLLLQAIRPIIGNLDGKGQTSQKSLSDLTNEKEMLEGLKPMVDALKKYPKDSLMPSAEVNVFVEDTNHLVRAACQKVAHRLQWLERLITLEGQQAGAEGDRLSLENKRGGLQIWQRRLNQIRNIRAMVEADLKLMEKEPELQVHLHHNGQHHAHENGHATDSAALESARRYRRGLFLTRIHEQFGRELHAHPEMCKNLDGTFKTLAKEFQLKGRLAFGDPHEQAVLSGIGRIPATDGSYTKVWSISLEHYLRAIVDLEDERRPRVLFVGHHEKYNGYIEEHLKTAAHLELERQKADRDGRGDLFRVLMGAGQKSD